MTKIAVGALVGADRAWALHEYRRCLQRQTLPPDKYCFVLSPDSDEVESIVSDGDWGAPVRACQTRLPFYPRSQRNADPGDQYRARHLSDLRNELRRRLLATGADILVSLDTDILLEDETILEQLVATIRDGWDVVAPTTYLHPLGPRSGCTNVGWWVAGTLDDPRQVWRRADANDVLLRRPPVKVDIPMAVYAIRRFAMGMCRYGPHESGEDLGFAQSLARKGMRVAWRPDLEVRHVWGPEYLDQTDGWKRYETVVV